MAFVARIRVTLKPAVSDPAGQTVLAALRRMGHGDAVDARIGKFLELRLEGETRESAEKAVHRMCADLLSNPVIEDYSFDLEEVA